MSTPRDGAPPWLFGPARDLILGCGLGYLGMFAVLTTSGDTMRALLPIGLMPLLTLALSVPHYGATLWRVYEQRRDRQAYAFFAFYFTAALFAAFALGVRSAWIGSALITLYLSWSPWHYTGQNFGIAMMFLRRRGIDVTPGARRALHASFVLSFLMMLLSLHSYPPTGTDPVLGERFQFLAVPLPGLSPGWLVGATGLGWLVSGVAAIALLRRAAGFRALGPALGLMALQGLWFALPSFALIAPVLAEVEPLGRSHATYALLWIALGHAVQYLWVTAFYVTRREGSQSYSRFLGRALIAGSLVWTLPALLFAPGVLGDLPFDSGLALLVASVVNLHHFVLDGAIWKLRSSRVAKVLIANSTDATAEPITPSSGVRGLAWPALAVLGCAALAINATGVIATEGRMRAIQAGDLEGLQRAGTRLAWLGRDSPEVH